MKDDLRSVFVAETRGLLRSLREGLAGIETNPLALPELFRWAHTLKGDVEMAGLSDIETIVVPMVETLRAAKEKGGLGHAEAELLSSAVGACEDLLSDKPVRGLPELAGDLARAAAPQRADAAKRTMLNVLVVEDSRLQRQVVADELGRASDAFFKVETAGRLDGALQRLAAGGVDAVLLDLSLPDSQGVETFERVSRASPETPVIILTITNDDALALEAIRKGAQDYLVKKQLQVLLLSRIVRYAVERKRLDTELRRTRESLEQRVKERTGELERSNSELRLFASAASHELRAPLRRIISYGDLLKRRSQGRLDQEALGFVEMMRSAAHALDTLLASLRELTQVTTATRPLEPVELDAVLSDVALELRPAVEEAGGRLEIGPMPRVLGDPIQLGQLFRNLILNSLKYRRNEEPARIAVSSLDAGDCFELAVEDNGIGFEQQYAQQLFQPFHRLHGSGRYEGLGLGLAICARIVWRHGGRIYAEGRPDQGARFIIQLPKPGPGPAREILH